jgi:hypothetical protein
MSARKQGIAGWLLVAAVALGMAERTNGQVREPQRPEVRGVVKAVDAGAGTITVVVGEGREPATDKTFSLAKHVEVAIGPGVAIGRGGLFKEGKLADLAEGVRITLTLSADQKTVESILAEGPIVRGQLKAVDTKKNTLTIGLPAQREQAGEEKTYALAPNTEVAVDDGRGRRFSVKEAKLTDLAPGAQVTAWLSLDSKQVQAILAEGPSLYGTIKALDPAKKTLTLVVRPPRGDDAGEEKTLTVSSDAVVLLDDGKGRRLSLKEGKLADVPTGAVAAVKLSVDQASVMFIRAEGPTLTGLLKAVDPDKGILVLTIPKGRDDAEEKTLTVAKDARITIDGNEAKLTNLKVGDNGPLIQVRLSLDQKTVLLVLARQPQPR